MGNNENSNAVSSKNKRLAKIRSEYEHYRKRLTMTPEQRREQKRKVQRKAKEEVISMMRNSGASDAQIANMRNLMSRRNDDDEDDEHDEELGCPVFHNKKIIKWKLLYAPLQREVTITTETSRHWRTATIHDIGRIVYLTDSQEFGELDDLDTEVDEEFSEKVEYTYGVIYTSSGMETPRLIEKKFHGVLVVPEELFDDSRREAPPGKLFSGRTVTGTSQWSPAPKGKAWFSHPFYQTPEKPEGKLVSFKGYCYRNIYVTHGKEYYASCENSETPTKSKKEQWKSYYALEYWCPVLKRFLSEGERFYYKHWFHNGNGTANQRYFYTQNEMLDRHGGLKNLPLSIGDDGLVVTEVQTLDQVLDQKLSAAEKNGLVVDLDAASVRGPSSSNTVGRPSGSNKRKKGFLTSLLPLQKKSRTSFTKAAGIAKATIKKEK